MLKINNEYSKLLSVIVGTADSNGSTPSASKCYDPKSREHVQRGIYPEESALKEEINHLAELLQTHGVEVIRPEILANKNQIFTRDIGFVVQDKFVISNMLLERSGEVKAISKLINTFDERNIIHLPNDAYIEGGDIILGNEYLFIGCANDDDFERLKVARTNYKGVAFIQNQFPDFEVLAFELNKSDEDAHSNSLHLDCCFQPLGLGHCLIFPDGFKFEKDLDIIHSIFGKDNCIEISQEEMYLMGANLFSVTPDTIISERGFERINQELRNKGYTVEEIKYSETAKMEGLLRCSTLPLERN